MPINAIQFQHGLSRPQFQARYSNEQPCERALVASRWPHGWRCACKRYFLTRNGTVMQTMGQRDARYPLQGRVEIDDAYLGGERAGSINGGRKAANKSAFVAAVQTRDDARPLYMSLAPVTDLRESGDGAVVCAPPGAGLPCRERWHTRFCAGAASASHT